jgi:hypothetical protein
MRGMTLPIPVAVLAIVVVVTILGGCGSSQTGTSPAPAGENPVDFVPDTKPVPVAKWKDATVPKGTVLKLSLIDLLNSGTTAKGAAFRTLVTEAIVIGGTVTIPSGSNVLGEVKEVIPGATGFKGKGGMLLLEFDRVETPTGASAELKASLSGLAPPRGTAVLAGPADPGVITGRARGREAVVEPSTPLTIVLQEPLLIKVRQ